MNVKILPHVAKNGTVFDQMQIFSGKRRVGYCGTKPGRPVNFLVKLSKQQEQEVLDEVKREIGEASKVSQAPVLVDDEDEDDD